MLKRSENGTVFYWVFRVIGAVGNQVIESLGHELQRLYLAFDLQLLFDRASTHVPATRGLPAPQREQLRNFGQGKTTVLRLSDEMNLTHRVIVVQASATAAFSTRRGQAC